MNILILLKLIKENIYNSLKIKKIIKIKYLYFEQK